MLHLTFNVTLVGLKQDGSTKDARIKIINALRRIRRTIENFIITDFDGYAFKIEDDTKTNFSNSLSINNTILFNNDGFANAADSIMVQFQQKRIQVLQV